LQNHWNSSKNTRPFLINFLHSYSFANRINLKRLIELGIITNIDDAPRGLRKITKEQFFKIIDETKTDESIIVD
jgi:hypothetical protein